MYLTASTSRALFKSFCEGKITTLLVAFFMQTIKNVLQHFKMQF